MKNIEYLSLLMLVFSDLEQISGIVRKIRNILVSRKMQLDPLDGSLFCFRCCTPNIPVRTCTIRIEKEEIAVICKKCKSKVKISINACRKSRDKVNWIRSTYTIDRILEED